MTDKQLLDWLDKHPNMEVAAPRNLEESGWRVYEVTGNVNDREWEEIGSGETVRDALESAALTKRK